MIRSEDERSRTEAEHVRLKSSNELIAKCKKCCSADNTSVKSASLRSNLFWAVHLEQNPELLAAKLSACGRFLRYTPMQLRLFFLAGGEKNPASFRLIIKLAIRIQMLAQLPRADAALKKLAKIGMQLNELPRS